MARVGFERTIPVFKRAKTVHALDRSTTMIGSPCRSVWKMEQESPPDGQSKGPKMYKNSPPAVDASYENNLEYSNFGLRNEFKFPATSLNTPAT
jgi:hypothetical protein